MYGEKILGREYKNKKVAIIGVGGIGCGVVNLIGRNGIKLLLIDDDVIEKSNLERQTIFYKSDVGKKKVEVAKERLKEFCEIEILGIRIDHENISEIGLEDCDLIIDCTDNAIARLLINDYCKKNDLDWIYSSAIKDIGCVKLFRKEGECYYCMNGEKEGGVCNSEGILNTTVSIVSSIVSQMAVEYLSDVEIDSNLIRIKGTDVEKYKVQKNPKCKVCNGEYSYLDGREMSDKEKERLCNVLE
jgi:molybdopterin/thiamine biosynthesis adenylyltransferase